MGLLFDVQDYKRLRVIVDTDAACEADDPFAIAHALMSPKLMVRGIVAEHFNVPGSVKRSYDEIATILEAMDKDVPFYMGQEAQITPAMLAGEEGAFDNVSEGVEFIINEALTEDEHPLFVLCQGAITNVAVAMAKCPEIKDKMTVIWIGTHGAPADEIPFREFNAGNDVPAANFVLGSGVNLWLVPSSVYITITIGIAEIQRQIMPYGKIGKHLFDQMVEYNNSEGAGWTKGESWSLGDSPAIAIAINPDCGHYKMIEAPVIDDETRSLYEAGRPMIRLYTDVDSRYVLGDFIAKLQLNYGE